MSQRIFHLSLVFSVTVFVFRFGMSAYPALADGFNPNTIISDNDMTNFSSMSLTGVQNFLTRMGGILGNYQANVGGVMQSAATIIYDASQNNQLNPEFILAQIQKESSLVTGHNSNLLDQAMGYGCPDGGGCSSNNAGFANQINGSASRFRNYLTDLQTKNSTISGWGVGKTKTSLDQVNITPTNNATAALYTYTPWVGFHGGDPNVGGNSSFFDIMNRFFPDRAQLVDFYPNNSLLQDTSTGSVYQLAKGKLRPITSYTALLADYNPNQIIKVDPETIAQYTINKNNPISIPKFLVIRDVKGGVYLIDNDHHRRPITSAATFKELGFNPQEVVDINNKELKTIPLGAPLTAADKYPFGAIIQNTKTGVIMFFDKNNTLHPVMDKTILETKFKGYPIYQESPTTFKQYPIAAPTKFQDGTLLKTNGSAKIYLVVNGQRRPILSGALLTSLGGMSHVIITSKAALKLQPLGAPFRRNTKQTISQH